MFHRDPSIPSRWTILPSLGPHCLSECLFQMSSARPTRSSQARLLYSFRTQMKTFLYRETFQSDPLSILPPVLLLVIVCCCLRAYSTFGFCVENLYNGLNCAVLVHASQWSTRLYCAVECWIRARRWCWNWGTNSKQLLIGLGMFLHVPCLRAENPKPS